LFAKRIWGVKGPSMVSQGFTSDNIITYYHSSQIVTNTIKSIIHRNECHRLRLRGNDNSIAAATAS